MNLYCSFALDFDGTCVGYVGGFETGTPVPVEPTLKYHPGVVEVGVVEVCYVFIDVVNVVFAEFSLEVASILIVNLSSSCNMDEFIRLSSGFVDETRVVVELWVEPEFCSTDLADLAASLFKLFFRDFYGLVSIFDVSFFFFELFLFFRDLVFLYL